MMEIVMTRCDKTLWQLDMMANWYDDMWQNIVTSLRDKKCDDEMLQKLWQVMMENCDNKTWQKIVTTRHDGKLLRWPVTKNCDIRMWQKWWLWNVTKILTTSHDGKLWWKVVTKNCDNTIWWKIVTIRHEENCDNKTWPSSFKRMLFLFDQIFHPQTCKGVVCF
jgi:hypothetical protein